MPSKSFWWIAAKRLIAGLVTLILVLALCAWIGSSIPRNGSWQEPETGIEILISTNGVHTEIVMPLTTPEYDWRGTFPASHLGDPSRPYTHIAVSWGERTFFLETPSWRDLELINAVSALTGGDAVLHVEHYVRPAPSPDYRVLRVRPAEYRKLAEQIASELDPPSARTAYHGYGQHDVFYSARNSYHLGNTCNQWTSDQLSAAGIATGWWSPLPGGVMKWVPPESLEH